MSRRVAISMLVLAAALAGVVVLRLAVGGRLGDLPAAAAAQAWELRQQRVVTGVVVGVCLAVGGVLLQSLLRNPLASPDLLGLSSGASLAVVVSIYLAATAAGARSGEGVGYAVSGWHAGPAMLGSMGALGLVYFLSQRRGLVEPATLVLVGVIVGIMCGAATMLVQHLMPDRGVGTARLLMGTLSDDVTWRQLAVVGTVAAAGLAVGVWAGPAMDAAAMGDDEARSVGVRLGLLRAGLFVTAGAMTAAAVVVAGPIGFVGLVCPHAVRLLCGPGVGGGGAGGRGGGGRGGGGHRVLVVGSALAGAALIVGADAGVRSLNLASGRVPIGVVTALLGGPAFIVLLRRRGESS